MSLIRQASADLTKLTSPTPPGVLNLRVLQTSDLHGALRGYDYITDKPSKVMGLARTATLIRAARTKATNSLLFDCGDFLQGSPICDFAAERTPDKPDGPHPMIAAMNALDYDAVTVGNHDFNYGANILFDALEQARFPVVSANFLNTDASPVFSRKVLLRRTFTDRHGNTHDLSIAAIGCLPPKTIDWDHQLAGHFIIPDMVQSVREQAALARNGGADLVIVLAHTGIDPAAPAHNAENALLALAALDDVDILLGGHTHMVFPSADAPAHPAIDPTQGLIHGKPVLMSGLWGDHLGQLDLDLQRNSAGRWHPIKTASKILPISRRNAQGRLTRTFPEDPEVLAATEHYHRATLRHIREPTGRTSVPLHSFFSLLANDSVLQLVAAAQADHLANAIAGTPLDGRPILSAAAPFKSGRRSGPQHFTKISPGPLTRRSLADLYSYPDTLCAVHLSGVALRDWLEHSASLFSRIQPKDTQKQSQDQTAAPPLFDENVPGYKFEIIYGLTYEIDLSQPTRFHPNSTLADPASRRIQNLRWNDAPIRDDQMFLLATNSYRAFGTGFDMLASGQALAPEIVYESREKNRELLRDFIQRNSPLDCKPRKVWSFAPLHGATAWFDTAPEARAFLDDPMLPHLEDLGDTPAGFARFRVTL